MEFEFWWFLGIPLFFALGWIAARVDIHQLVSESRSLPRNYFKGLNFLLTEQHDKAIDSFIEIVKLDPESADMHFALGNLFRRRGETERAIRVHQNLLARPDLPQEQQVHAAYELGMDYLKAGLLDRAEETFNGLVETQYAVQARRALLEIFQREKEWPRAIEAALGLQESGAGARQKEIAQFYCELAHDALVHMRPDEAIALGAAVQAGLKMRDAALDEVVMTDVAPYSLGIGVSRQLGPNQYEGGHYLPIIERNSVVPVSRTENIVTIHDHQKEINVAIYQGESRLVADNVFLGKITFPIPAKKAGEVGIDVRFTYDISGVLEAEVTVLATQERHKMVISDNAGVMTAEQIEQRFAELADLKIHPRDQMENRTLVSRADRLYEQSLGDVRQYLAAHTANFQAALESQDPATIRKARQTLDEVLRQVESESFL